VGITPCRPLATSDRQTIMLCRHAAIRRFDPGGMPMSASVKCLAAVALAGASAAPAGAQLLARKDLSYDIAKTVAETAIADCKARGYNTSVVVVDRAGETLVAMRYDNASPHTL